MGTTTELGPLCPSQILGGIAKHNLNVIKGEVENKGRFKVNYMKRIFIISALVREKFNVSHICRSQKNNFSLFSKKGQKYS